MLIRSACPKFKGSKNCAGLVNSRFSRHAKLGLGVHLLHQQLTCKHGRPSQSMGLLLAHDPQSESFSLHFCACSADEQMLLGLQYLLLYRLRFTFAVQVCARLAHTVLGRKNPYLFWRLN